MISERDIADKFSAIWKQNFPLLTPSFIKVLNENHVEVINTCPVLVESQIRFDLVSEIAFSLSELVFHGKISIDDISSSGGFLLNLAKITARNIWASDDIFSVNPSLSHEEMIDIVLIVKNTIEFINKHKGSTVEFRPKLSGYGFIPDLSGDILIDSTLYEIKTVKRNFRSSDLKQLFIYLALKQVKDHKCWKEAGLYNPRRGTYCKFNVKAMISKLSGGRTPNETFENLLNELVRDIVLDSKF